MTTALQRYGSVYGMRIAGDPDFPLVFGDARGDDGHARVRVMLGDVDDATGAPEIWRTTIDGRDVVVKRDTSSNLHIAFGDEARFRVASDGSSVMCSPRSSCDPLRWQRFFLDTVLWSTALVRGSVALHAAAVADTTGAATAVVGGTGGGKTSLALALVQRGGALVSDDVLVVSHLDDTGMLAHPAPPLVNVDVNDGHLYGGLGRVLAEFDGECWMAVDRSEGRPVPLRAVVILSRTGIEAPSRLHRAQHALLQLEAHSISLPGLPRLQARRRFEVLADLASRVPLLELQVPRSLPSDAVADVLQDRLPLIASEPVATLRRVQPEVA